MNYALYYMLLFSASEQPFSCPDADAPIVAKYFFRRSRLN